MNLSFGWVEGLPEEELIQLNELAKVYNYHESANRKKRRYYDGKITLNEVNLGIALPSSIRKLEIGCAWGAKTVDVLASRSMFDGFVTEAGEIADELNQIIRRSKLLTSYSKAAKEELKYGSAFGTVSMSEDGSRIRFHSPQAAAALWDSHKEDIECGLAFEDMKKDEMYTNWSPEQINFYTATDTWELTKQGGKWTAERYPHNFGRPLMVAMTWDATTDKPFGQSRLKEPIRRLIQGYVRTVANATIGLEFATSPQKYLLGVTDEQYDEMVDHKFRSYVGSIMLGTTNPETGDKPSFGQLSQGTIEPHVQMMRTLATQFSAATGLTVTDTGVVNDANPTSSDAILAQTQTLVAMAEQLNAGNSEALYTLSQMAIAMEYGTTPDELDEDLKGVVAHFKNPSMPSIAATADAAIKIASAREGFAQTDIFLEMIGFDQADIRRIKSQEQRGRGSQILLEEFVNANIDKGLEEVHQSDVANKSDSSGSDAGMDQ